jgi:hypothetical protein
MPVLALPCAEASHSTYVSCNTRSASLLTSVSRSVSFLAATITLAVLDFSTLTTLRACATTQPVHQYFLPAHIHTNKHHTTTLLIPAASVAINALINDIDVSSLYRSSSSLGVVTTYTKRSLRAAMVRTRSHVQLLPLSPVSNNIPTDR